MSINYKFVFGLVGLLALGSADCVKPETQQTTRTAIAPIIYDLRIDFLDEQTLQELKRRVTPETIGELSRLVLNHPYGTAEAGGFIYATPDRLGFFEMQNVNNNLLRALENANPCDPNIVHYMKILLETYFGGGECQPENADQNGWGNEVREVRELLESSINHAFCAPESLEWLRRGFRNTYRMDRPFSHYSLGTPIGKLHTHSNRGELSGFSDIDMYISYDGAMFLVSHNYPNGEMFRLSIARNGESEVIGEYLIDHTVR